MPTALILAAGSFIGRHLGAALEGSGHTVVRTLRTPDGAPGSRICDLTIAEDVARVVAEVRPRWIVQCAGATGSRDDLRSLYGLHVGAARHVLTAVKDHAPEAVTVFFGSAAEYGAAPPEALPIRESHAADPTSFFGASKLAQTHLARAAAAQWKLRVLVVRPSNVVGPGLPQHYLAASLAARLRGLLTTAGAGTPDLAVANARATRDFVDVRDIVRGVELLLEVASPAAGRCEIYNLSTGRETEVIELARSLCELTGGIQPIDAGAAASRTDISRSCCSAEKITRATGWRAEISLAQSLADLWAEFSRA